MSPPVNSLAPWRADRNDETGAIFMKRIGGQIVAEFEPTSTAWADATHIAETLNSAEKANAAMAELIAAAREVRAAHRELPSKDHGEELRNAGEARISRAHYALEAALARVEVAA